MVFAAGALVLVAAAVAAVLVLNGSSSTPDRAATVSPGAVYRARVAAALRPVAYANRTLAAALLAMHGKNSARARRADSAAQQAVSTARGALSALTPPAAGQTLNTQARQALDHESSYLGAVGATLRDTSSPQRSQVPSLAGNMTSAFETVGAPLAASTGNVTASAGHLVSWAHHRAAAAAAARRARQRRAAAGQSSGSSTTSTAASNPLANGRDCGSGLYAGPNTSCDFAQNVQDAWMNAPGVTNTVEVYSPVTGNTYTMNCSPAGSGITCSGGNNASVSWSF